MKKRMFALIALALAASMSFSACLGQEPTAAGTKRRGEENRGAGTGKRKRLQRNKGSCHSACGNQRAGNL